MSRVHTHRAATRQGKRLARIGLPLMIMLAMILPSVVMAAPANSAAAPAPAQTSPAAAANAPVLQDAPETGTISGTVFRDYNANGTRNTDQLNPPYLFEPGIAGVVINAYDVNGAVAGSTTSGAGGAYSFTATGASGFRVEFTLPADNSLNFLQVGAAGPTTVVFVPTGGQTGLNVGFNNPIDFSQINPPLVTARTAFGPRSGLPAFVLGATTEQPNESIIGLDFDEDGDLAPTDQHRTYATLAQTGTLYGMIYQRRSKLILGGTYFKSYADTGPIQSTGFLQNVDPLGAIYGVKVLSGTPNPNTNPATVYANLNKIIDPSTGLPVPGNPAGVDPRRTGTINYNTNDCDGPGAGGAPSDGASCWQHDPAAWDKVGSIGLGDLEEDDTETFVFAVNLADKKLYQLPIDPNPLNWPITTLAASPKAIPNTCAVSSDAVPGALGFSDGKLYVGVTCTAESTQIASQLKAEVWRFDPATQTFSAAPVFSVPLGYPRGCIFASNDSANAPKNVGSPLENCQELLSGASNTIDNANWLPWPATWTQHFQNNSGINTPGRPGWTTAANANAVQLEYPHPWLSDISFVGNDLVMGFRDINGDRTGNAVRSPNINPTAGGAGNVNGFPISGTPVASWMTTYGYNFAGAGLGDLMRACWNGSGWTLESNGTCGTGAAQITTPGANNGQGPGTGTYPPTPGAGFSGYGEFYWDDSGPGSRNPSVGTGVSGLNYIGHEQTMMGGTYQMAGWPDLAVTIADQFGYGDGGLSRFSNVVNNPFITLEADGDLNTSWGVLTYPSVLSDNNLATGNEAGLALRHTRLYGVNAANCQATNTCWWFGKANGLGDVESLSDSAPLELGNRLWCDTGVSGVGAYNGIQDPGEATVPNGVTVRLTCGTEYAEVNTSGGTGSYLFTDAIWDASANAAGIIPRNTTCTISVDTTGANGTALTSACGGIAATVPNAQGDSSNSPVADIRDSDATVVFTGGAITSAQIPVLTGGPGVNNHGLDFGFGAPQDYGDAPDPTYPTLSASNGAHHTIVAGIRMGAAVDSEQNGQPNTAATGDDIANVDDEDAVTFSALAAGQPAVASISMAGLSGTPVCYLNAWIDFNGNGSWESPAEQIATNVALNGGGTVPVGFNVPVAVTTSPTYARFRCSTTQNLTPTGSAPNGEVEDYRVTIEQTASLDYGDAPDPTYPTFSGSGGASHVLGANGPRLGACVDAETNGQPNVSATGDDVAIGSPVFGTCAGNDDEDGVTIPTLTEQVASNITVNVSNATCVLNAWIDFNGNGNWNDAGEQVASNVSMAPGSHNLSVTPPVASTQATTYARFRCSTQSGLGTTGAAADGEVEDYTVTIQAGSAANDWGDAPDTGAGTGTGNYQTIGTDNGAHHVIVANVYLGACVDAEINGLQSVGADGDNNATGGTPAGTGTCAVAGNDEDGMTIPTLLAGQAAQLVASRTASTACYLNGWIDFNGNGSWLDAGEQVATNVLLPAGVTNLAVNVPGTAVNGQTYARFRCSTQQNLAPTGVATDGEVEDYAVQITGAAVDWGDLPDGPYVTLSSTNGPSHVLSGVAFMGKCVDAEGNGQPNSGATGDDGNATTPRLGACASLNDDEDGVTFGTLTAGANGTANVDMSAFNTSAQVCFLNAWIDFNGNGSFADAGDQIASNLQMIGGPTLNAVTFPIPSVVTSTPTGARFRCSTQSNLTPVGPAPNGEVEDYMVTLVPQQRDFGDAPDAAAGTGVGNYNTTAADNGPSHRLGTALRLGAVTPDADSGALQNVAADADDINQAPPDDEDGVSAIPVVSSGSTTVALQVTVFNSTASSATVACWIDFNRDGVFGSAERASATVAASSGTTTPTLNFSGFGSPVPGPSYLRCRIATAAGEVNDATGPAATGEVEDYPLNISGADFGDAPDTAAGTAQGNYQTRGADSGPYHAIVNGLNLGSIAPDNDPATLQDAAALADNNTNIDDEDSISVLPSIYANSPSVQMNVSATNSTGNAAVMACWIDFNRDGDFTDSGEKSANVTVPAGSGTASYPVSLTGFAAPTEGVTYIRCRIAFSAGDIANPTGGAASGEVEDFQVTVQAPLAVVLADFNAATQTDHILVTWETVSELDNAGFNLYRSATDAAPEQLLANVASQAPGSAQGAFYSYQDFAVEAGQGYFYWLETVDLSGVTALNGPVNATMLTPTAVTLSNVDADSGATTNLLWLLVVAAGLALAAVYGLRRGTAR